MGVVVLYAFNPGWWADPVSGVERFLRSNLTRGKTIPIPVEFLGRVYDTPRESLPWYNTLVWTVFVTPVGFLGWGWRGPDWVFGGGFWRCDPPPARACRAVLPPLSLRERGRG